jgi:WD40 repeat protein/serine/threonine protein kinase
MAADRLASFLDALRETEVLEPAQLEEVNLLPQSQGTDPVPLARLLVHKGWLSRYQVNQLVQGRGRDLVLGPYRVLDRIGEGAMGQVFKAHHAPMNRIVALKLIRKERLGNPEAVRRFYREVQAAAKLAHPNIVLAYDAGQVGNTHYFAMEYVDGFTLDRVVREAGPRPIAQACDFIRQAALGLQHAFERNLVHRDIKPANLLLTRPAAAAGSNGARPAPAVIKILDMGLARLQEGPAENVLTQDGKVVGTPDYLSPEQALDARQADIRSDLYSLGCTFYFLLTGRPPFAGSSMTEVLLKHQMEQPAPLVHLRPDVPAEVATIVARLMAKSPDGRYQTPAEVAADLEPWCQPGARGAGPATSATSEWAALTGTPGAGTDGEASSGTDATQELADTQEQEPAPDPEAARRKRLFGLGIGACLHLLGLALLAYYFLSPSKKASIKSTETHQPQVVHKAPEPHEGDANDRRPTTVRPNRPLRADPEKGLANNMNPINTIAFAPNGRILVHGNELGVLMVAQVQNAQPVGRLEGQVGPVRCAAFSADGKRVSFAGEGDFAVRVWDPEGGMDPRRFSGHAASVIAVAFTPDGRRLLSASRDGTLRAWDLATGAEVLQMGDAVFNKLRCVAFAASGRRALAGYNDGSLVLWDLDKGIEKTRFRGHEKTVWSVALTPDGKLGLSGGGDGKAKLWEVEAGKEVQHYDGHKGRVTAVAFWPDGSRVVTGGVDGLLRVCALKTGKEDYRDAKPDLMVISVAVSPDQRLIVAGCQDNNFRTVAVSGPAVAVKPGPAKPEDKTPARLPVPDEAKQAEAEKLIKELFKEDYAKRRAADRLALAAKLLQKAVETRDDPAARYVLLRETRDLAATAGDVPTVVMAVEEMARAYAVDGPEVKLAALSKASQSATTSAAHQAVVEAVFNLLGEPLAADHFEPAGRLIALAESSARKAGNPGLVSRVDALSKEVSSLRKAHVEVQTALEVLKKDPADPAANLAVGKYLCFRKGNWDEGLPLLAQGGTDKLVELAKRDLARPLGAAEQVELGDAWWDLAQEQSAWAKNVLQWRAAFWYKQAVVGLSGLTQDRIEKRIKEVGSQAPAIKLPEIVGEMRRLMGHAGPVAAVAMSSDGRLAVSASADGSVRLWDVDAGKEVRQYEGAVGEMKAVALSADGRRILAGGPEGAWTWDVDDVAPLKKMLRRTACESLALTSDGRIALTGTSRGGVEVWDVDTGRVTWGISNGSWGPMHGLASAPNDRMVLFGSENGSIHLWDHVARSQVGKELRTSGGIRSLAFSPDGTQILVACPDKTVRIWDIKSGKLLRAIKGHTGPVTSAVYTPDGRRVLSGSEDKTVRLWDARTMREIVRFDWHTDKVWSVAVSADGRRAVSGSSDRTVRVWGLPK